MKPYYEHAGITIYHGDCREILPQLPKVDLVFTSPPYNMNNVAHFIGGGRHKRESTSCRWNPSLIHDGYASYADSLPWDEYEAWQREIILLCWTLVSPAGAIYYNHKPRILGTKLWTPLAVMPSEAEIRQIVVWSRLFGINYSTVHYVPTYEWIVIAAYPDFRLREKSASGVGDVWSIPPDMDTAHPCSFPEALPTRAIETTSARIILDPFCGSGTTLAAAKNLGRSAIGIEIEEKYCEIAAKRLSQEVFQFEEKSQ